MFAGLVGGIPMLAVPAFAASSSGSVSSNADLAAIAAKVNPAIVDINTTLPNGAAAGTGMVLTSSGEVLTNNHVIAGATSIKVQITGAGPSYDAAVLGYDVTGDVALLQIQGVSGLTTIPMTSSAQVEVGEDVVALGNALGKGGTPATAVGSVTAVDQTITATDEGGTNPEQLHGLIQVDAPIQPGDSGGPLANADGKVIGMDSAGSSDGNSQQGATEGYAIPIDNALAIVHEIEAGRGSDTIHIGPRAILGVEVQDASAATSSPFGGSGSALGGSGDLGGSGSALGGSGDLGGLGNLGSLGDLGNLGNLGSLGNLGNLGSIGDLIRGLAGLGSDTSGSNAGQGSTVAPGSSTAPASPAAGVQISGVASGSPADGAGLVAGDTITSVDTTSIATAADLSSALANHQPGDSVRVVWVDSSGAQHTASVTLVAGPPA